VNISNSATEKSEAIACARRCRSSRLTRWWTQKESSEKWRAEEEDRHKGSLTKKAKKSRIVSANFRNHKNIIGIIVTRLSANVD
jgi:hypothetical protein